MTTTPEYAQIRQRMYELAILLRKYCVSCGMPRPEGWRPSRCPECWAEEGRIAERNRRIARGEQQQ